MKKINVVDTFRRWALLLAILIMGIIFASISPSFMRGENLMNIVRQTAIMGILSIGLTFIVVSGEMDLSFSSVASLAAVLVLKIGISGGNPIVSWILVLGLGIVLGVINGIVVVNLKIPSLLGTIGTQLFFGGIVAWVAQGGTVWTAKFTSLFVLPGRAKLFGVIPAPIIIFLVFIVIAFIILEKTVLGRYFYAVGGNATAADHAGIDAKRIKFMGYIFMGFLGSVAGVIIAAQFASATPSVGTTYLFPSVIAVFLGSIFLKDGVPNLWGTVVACLLLSVLANGFNLIGLRYWHMNVTQGLIMVAAIAMMTTGKRVKP